MCVGGEGRRGWDESGFGMKVVLDQNGIGMKVVLDEKFWDEKRHFHLTRTTTQLIALRHFAFLRVVLA